MANAIRSPESQIERRSVKFENWAIGDYNDPGNSMFLYDVTMFDTSESENIAWFEPIGRNRAIAVVDEVMGVKITMALEFFDTPSYAKFHKYRLDQIPQLVLRSPWGEKWFVRFNEVWGVKVSRGEGPYRKVSCGFTQIAIFSAEVPEVIY